MGDQPFRCIPKLADQGDLLRLSEHYTYIALNLGPIYIPVDTREGWVKTYYDHHVYDWLVLASLSMPIMTSRTLNVVLQCE